MGLRIRYQGGAFTGTVLEFDDDVAVIRFGRNAQTCQVAFPEDEANVSREHFELRRFPGGYRLFTNRENAVLVDGVPGHDDQVLDAICTIQAGEAGPKVVSEQIGRAELAATRGRPTRQPGAHTRVLALGADVKKSRLLGLFAIALIAVSTLAAWIGYQVSQSRIDETAANLVLAREKIDDVRLESLRKISESKRAFAEVFERSRDSVYVVVRSFSSGGEKVQVPFGTAFVTEGGQLATNAHVAENFHGLEPGGALVARSTGRDPIDLTITGIELHPGYSLFAELQAQTGAFDPNVGGPLQLISACDVALMQVSESDRERLGPPLPLASNSDVQELESGVPLSFIGFPAEGIVHGGLDLSRPRPTFQIGSLTSTSDFFLAQAPATGAYLVHFSMPSAGGASGSPVFNVDGEVVAILSAGNFSQAEGTPRLPVGGITYGQRIDLLAELSAGLQPDALDARHAAWKQRFEAIFDRGLEGVFLNRRWAAERFLEQQTGQKAQLVEEHSEQIELTGAVPQHITSFAAPRSGWYFVLSVADRNVDIDSQLSIDGRPTGEDVYTDYHPAHCFPVLRGQIIKLRTFTQDPKVAPRTEVEVRIYSATAP